MRVLNALFSFCALAPGMASAATWHVSGSGDDANTGASAGQAFRTLQKAANATRPGDLVLVGDGTYVPPCQGCNVLDITTSGAPGAPIAFQAAAGAHPLVDFSNGWTGIQVDAAYISVSGFEVAGGAKNVSYAYAYANRKNLSNYLTGANGIIIDNFVDGSIPHHVAIRNNVVHDAPGGGISSCYADYVTIEGNTTYNNAFWTPYDSSGISIWEMRDVDGYAGYKNFIRRNLSYGNRNFIPFYQAGAITDGNGIIVDDNKNTQSNNLAYGGRTYVADNVVYLNGGSGIHAYDSQHVDIVGNTAYLNNQSPLIDEGQIFSNAGADVNILDNVEVAPPGKAFTSSYANGAGVTSDYNVYFSATVAAGLKGVSLGPHDSVADPLLAAPASGDFHLNADSPAIGAGTPRRAARFDFDRRPRPTPGGGYDGGAFQYAAPALRSSTQ